MPHFTLQQYHIMGSRILSRSFTVREREDRKNKPESNDPKALMEVDESEQTVADTNTGEQLLDDDDISDDDDDGSENVAMVPMADMLNARYGSENVNVLTTIFRRY
jgi:N-lysine methyltransferase SETD6